jgi:hypothetical protein
VSSVDYIRVEDPVLNIAIGLVRGVFSLGPVCLDLLNEALCVLLGTLLRLLALDAQILLERGCIPAGVGRNSLVIPVGLDGRLEALAVGRARMRDAVVTEPALQLRLMPLVVDCVLKLVCYWSWRSQESKGKGFVLYAPVLPNQLLAVAEAASVSTRVDARENFILSGGRCDGDANID